MSLKSDLQEAREYISKLEQNFTDERTRYSATNLRLQRELEASKKEVNDARDIAKYYFRQAAWNSPKVKPEPGKILLLAVDGKELYDGFTYILGYWDGSCWSCGITPSAWKEIIPPDKVE